MLQIKPPFLPKVQDDADFSNFDADFTREKPMVTPPDSKYIFVDRPQRFSYVSWLLQPVHDCIAADC